MLKPLTLALGLLALPVAAQEKSFDLQVPQELLDSGITGYLLPRFSLKTSIRINVADGPADAAFGGEGTPVFRQGDRIWRLARTDGPYPEAFEAWLLSDVGKRTIEAFKPDDGPLFSADVDVAQEVQVAAVTGNAVLGERISLQRCGRCHAVNETNRLKTIGSTPSFALLRTFDDWRNRFEAFYVLNPHGAFTQVEGITQPFAENLPSPIAPIEVTPDEIDAITAYVATIAPADLGAPLHSQ